MKKFLQKKLKNEKGLTLVELLAVIVILGIIAAIAIPSIGSIIENSRQKAILADASNAMEAANLYFVENPEEKTVELAELEKEFLDSAGSLLTATVTQSTTSGTTKTPMEIVFTAKNGKTTASVTTGITKDQLKDKANVTFNKETN
ncbi:prepilin-type N-terminal cleavage/methylation domain-containing protein [Sporosarcina sp. BI001-red]|uniref:prepilin-type N-terminal cleavage/methylation domain-containing protein n=1 Tax=Sporosarcina sp. BI001-red TaxID=2282866 RepID=UPI000E239C85|nr:prepilin-type N-terminal cleavage/methylation domain-containing protein [Sporosarcina sp. BI001-red]REB07172.1 prepilin-type N-terminal cleavage/methylation domain-containing protein [Sporosarcina sp. BI001-red]